MKSMSPRAKKTTKIVVDVVFWIFFVFALAFTVLAFMSRSSAVNGFPQIGDKTLLTVQTDSMKSDRGFATGDLIVSKVIKDDQKAISELQPDQVITFKWTIQDQDGSYKTIFVDHRIIEVHPQGERVYFTTHGDANPEGVNETPRDDQVLAVWTGQKIPGLGGFINFLQPPQWGFFVFIIIPLAGFLTYEIIVLVKTVQQMKGKGTHTLTAAEEELIKQKAIEEFLEKQEAEKASEKKTDKNKK